MKDATPLDSATKAAKEIFKAKEIFTQLNPIDGSLQLHLVYELPRISMMANGEKAVVNWLTDIVKPIAEIWDVTRQGEVDCLKERIKDVSQSSDNWMKKYLELDKEVKIYKDAMRDLKGLK